MKRLFFTLCFLLIAVDCFAASSRVLPASYTEYTYDSAGGGEDYTALATWEADTDIDVRSTGQVLTCSSGIHNDTVTLAEATTDADGFRLIRAAEGSRGTPTSGVRFEKSSSATVWIFIIAAEDYSSVHDIYAKAISTLNNGTAISFGANTGPTGNAFVGCYATAQATTGSTAYGIGYYLRLDFGSVQYVINSVADSCQSGASSTNGAAILVHPTNTNYGTACIYNSTLINNQFAAIRTQQLSTNVYIKNTIAIDVSTFEGNTFTQTTNATSGVTFAADGYHLASNDTVAINNGTDLSADATFAFDDDIDGETRDDWDIGADEYVASGTRRRVIIVSD